VPIEESVGSMADLVREGQFALHEATLVLGLLLRRYELRPEPDYRLRVTERLTLMPEGLRLHPEHRTPVPAPAPEPRCPVPGADA
ncbi:hypothetical protein ABZ322_42830, partial [Streptomyces sp. NPDC006129]